MTRQTHARLNDLVPDVTPAGVVLTPEDWALIRKAVAVFQHNLRFRAVYEKLACN